MLSSTLKPSLTSIHLGLISSGRSWFQLLDAFARTLAANLRRHLAMNRHDRLRLGENGWSVVFRHDNGESEADNLMTMSIELVGGSKQ